ncbi:MAG: flagellar biosynthesis protein, partial [Lachnospiraceae bacterium]|nr:flagellar biosynthesis protein [Lachnospiraceae bacterium]
SKEAEGGNRGIPGTDSNNNDNTTYVFPDTGYSSEVINETDIKRAPSETITKTNTPAGVIIPDESSISVVASKYTIYREEDLEKAGTLNGTTFEAYAAANSTPTKMEVDQDLITQVANATGIAAERISVTAYDTPLFQPRASSGPSISEILQYVLMGLVILLLGFVVIRSTRPAEVIETEPELSVESLLQSTKEELEDIGLQEKSETRVMIEKFVDENPEAVANLLRNWLTEDWE